MMNYPGNYEEAKKIIIDSTTNEVSKHNKKAYKLRALFTSAASVAVACTAAAVTNQPAVIATLIPAVGVVSLSSLLPLYGYNKASQQIQNGSYFANKSEEEIMEIARKYVDTYNAYEKGQEAKTGGIRK